MPAEIPILLFDSAASWADWLDGRDEGDPGVWLRIAKKKAKLRSVTYAEALEVALCHGWIDSQKKSYDEESWLQRFTPRGPRSIWSKVNREKAMELMESGRMKPAGLRAVERAREDGRWDAAYDPQSRTSVPDDLQTELDRDPAAAAFFASLDRVNRYAILFRIQTSRTPEARTRKIAAMMELLRAGRKIHS